MTHTMINITKAEYVWAAQAGIIRQQQNILRETQRKDAYGADPAHGYDLNTLGAVGEYVASIALGVTWRGPGIFRGEDIAGYQVRTRPRLDWDLILHDEDPDDARFVLVVGGPLLWSVPGWIVARDGKKKVFWRDPAGGRPAYFVPQDRLRPIKELRELKEAA